jgi:hypothetical protein
MDTWKPLSFADQALITKKLVENPLPLSDYPFTNLWMWNVDRNYHLALVENFLCIRFQDKDKEIFLYPIGAGSRLKAIERLYQEQKEKDVPFLMRAIPEEALPELASLPFPSTVAAEEGRFDYVYSFEDLLHLKGNRYQAKRNLIYQFENNYEFSYQEITIDLLPSIKRMEEKWFFERKTHHKSSQEHQAAIRLLEHFFSLNIQGGALLVNQEVIAYSAAEYIGSVMLLIHIEKALPTFKGAYQMMNQQLLKHMTPSLYVNKEESLGFAEIAKSKDSYHPLYILKKFLLSA